MAAVPVRIGRGAFAVAVEASYPSGCKGQVVVAVVVPGREAERLERWGLASTCSYYCTSEAVIGLAVVRTAVALAHQLSMVLAVPRREPGPCELVLALAPLVPFACSVPLLAAAVACRALVIG